MITKVFSFGKFYNKGPFFGGMQLLPSACISYHCTMASVVLAYTKVIYRKNCNKYITTY